MAIRQAPTNNTGGFLVGEWSRRFMEEHAGGGGGDQEIRTRTGSEMESWEGKRRGSRSEEGD